MNTHTTLDIAFQTAYLMLPTSIIIQYYNHEKEKTNIERV